MPNTIKHAAWDGGAISEAFSFFTKQKTVKTRCGKRVSMGHVANGKATCAACQAELERERIAHERIALYAAMVQSHGIEAANRMAEGWRD